MTNAAEPAGLRVPARIQTERLLLRLWQDGDRAPFAELNADPEVTEHLSGPMTRAESDALADRALAGWEQRGYGWYAVQERSSGDFLGFCGLGNHRALPDEVEVGWRLRRSAWGNGYATEAALACRDEAFTQLGLDRLVSITTRENVRSWNVMGKLGMTWWREIPLERWLLQVWRLQTGPG